MGLRGFRVRQYEIVKAEELHPLTSDPHLLLLPIHQGPGIVDAGLSLNSPSLKKLIMAV